MVKRFEDLYYEGDVYGDIMQEVYELREELDAALHSPNDSSNLIELVNAFWEWAEKADKLEREAFERGETNFDGDEEYEEGRNYRWIIRDLSDIKKLEGHIKEKELLGSFEAYYKENYKN